MRTTLRRFPIVMLCTATLTAIGCADSPDATRGETNAVEGTIALPEEGSPFIAFDLWVKAGSQDDPEGKEGLAALTGNLLAAGSTQDLSYQQILERLYPMATGYSAYIDKEMTTFRGVVHRDNLDAYYQLLSAALLRPAFQESDFERVKKQTMNFLERGRRFQRDEELSKELLFSVAYADTPYEHPEEGYVQSVSALTLDDVKAFYREHYTASNIVVGVGGGYPEGFVERVRVDFDALPEESPQTVAASKPQRPDGVKVLIVEKDTDATAISIGFPIDVTRAHEDFYELKLTASWLGEHRSSFGELYQTIRSTRGMNYGDYAYVEAFPLGYTTQERPINVARRSQLFEIWIRPISGTAPGNQNDRALFATRAALRVLDRLVENGIPEDQVERTKEFLHNFTVNYGSTALRRLAFAVDDAFYGIEDRPYLASVRDELAELEAEGVHEAIQRHLQTDDYYLVFITRDAEALRDKLVSGAPTPITYAGEQPPEVLAEDEEIASFPIPVDAEDVTIIDILDVFESGPDRATAPTPSAEEPSDDSSTTEADDPSS